MANNTICDICKKPIETGGYSNFRFDITVTFMGNFEKLEHSREIVINSCCSPTNSKIYNLIHKKVSQNEKLDYQIHDLIEKRRENEVALMAYLKTIGMDTN